MSHVNGVIANVYSFAIREDTCMDINNLIETHLDNVKRAAYRYYKLIDPKYHGMISKEDLISAGNVGLVEAAGKYKEGGKAKFSTYAYEWINGAIKAELEFYIGTEVLLLDDETWEMIPAEGRSVEDEVIDKASSDKLSEEEKSTVIMNKLKEYKLTENEIRVFLAVNGIGRKKAENFRSLARELGIREMDVRRFNQSAERKIRKEIYDAR